MVNTIDPRNIPGISEASVSVEIETEDMTSMDVEEGQVLTVGDELNRDEQDARAINLGLTVGDDRYCYRIG